LNDVVFNNRTERASDDDDQTTQITTRANTLPEGEVANNLDEVLDRFERTFDEECFPTGTTRKPPVFIHDVFTRKAKEYYDRLAIPETFRVDNSHIFAGAAAARPIIVNNTPTFVDNYFFRKPGPSSIVVVVII